MKGARARAHSGVRKGALLLVCGLSFSLVGYGLELRGAERNVGGAPLGFTGGFEEMSCDACHFDHELNPPGGSLAIEGVPERYTPGERYALAVTLIRPGMKVAGFQLAARFAESGHQAGAITPLEGETGRVAVALHAGVQYLQQTDPGSRFSVPDTARWSFVWTAPSVGGSVIFHVAGNAGDGDGSTLGDFVHTAEAETLGPLP